MTPVTSAGPTTNTVYMAGPHNMHSVIPVNMSQVPLYPHNRTQVNLIPGNRPGFQTSASAPPAQTTLKEGKTLGALQILIGLVHMGLGAILGTALAARYHAISFIGGYPFWGGISFIISGSLTVASEQQPNYPCLLKGSLGMNILSAIFSVLGLCLLIADIITNHRFTYYLETLPFLLHAPGLAASGVLLIFNLLELCIASTCAHFGCQLASYETVVYQNVYIANQVATPEPMNSPPSYSGMAQDSK